MNEERQKRVNRDRASKVVQALAAAGYEGISDGAFAGDPALLDAAVTDFLADLFHLIHGQGAEANVAWLLRIADRAYASFRVEAV